MQVLITENTIVNHGDDRGGVDQAQGDIVDVNKDTAKKLVECGRALYMKKSDDPSKGGLNTATGEIIKAAKEMAKAKADAVKTAASGSQNSQ